MLGLRKAPKLVFEDMDRWDVHLGENGNGSKSSATTDENGTGTKKITAGNRRRLPSRALRTAMVGPHMILVPRPELDGGSGGSRSIPALD